MFDKSALTFDKKSNQWNYSDAFGNKIVSIMEGEDPEYARLNWMLGNIGEERHKPAKFKDETSRNSDEPKPDRSARARKEVKKKTEFKPPYGSYMFTDVLTGAVFNYYDTKRKEPLDETGKDRIAYTGPVRFFISGYYIPEDLGRELLILQNDIMFRRLEETTLPMNVINALKLQVNEKFWMSPYDVWELIGAYAQRQSEEGNEVAINELLGHSECITDDGLRVVIPNRNVFKFSEQEYLANDVNPFTSILKENHMQYASDLYGSLNEDLALALRICYGAHL